MHHYIGDHLDPNLSFITGFLQRSGGKAGYAAASAGASAGADNYYESAVQTREGSRWPNPDSGYGRIVNAAQAEADAESEANRKLRQVLLDRAAGYEDPHKPHIKTSLSQEESANLLVKRVLRSSSAE